LLYDVGHLVSQVLFGISVHSRGVHGNNTRKGLKEPYGVRFAHTLDGSENKVFGPPQSDGDLVLLTGDLVGYVVGLYYAVRGLPRHSRFPAHFPLSRQVQLSCMDNLASNSRSVVLHLAVPFAQAQ
jgi:hypothetical protein